MRASQIAGITFASLATAGLGYAVYFDYKRRNDPDFVKKLRKEAKKTSKANIKDSQIAKKRLTNLVATVVKEVNQPGILPADASLREKFFLENISAGETLIALGPAGYEQSATAFFRAMKVYPQPVELFMIYQKATPEEVFSLIMMMVEADREVGGEGYDVDDDGVGSQDPLSALVGLAQSAPRASGQSSRIDEVDDESTPKEATSSADLGEEAASTAPSGPSSQASSQEWDKLSGASLQPSPPVDSNATVAPSSEAGKDTQASVALPSTEQTTQTISIEVPSNSTTASAGSGKEGAVTSTEEKPSGESEAQSPSPFNFASQSSFAPSPIFKEGEEPEQ